LNPGQILKNYLYLYEFLIKLSTISLKYQNDLAFDKFLTMEFDEFLNYFSSFIFSLNGNFRDIKNSLLLLNEKNVEMKKLNKQQMINLMKFLTDLKDIKFNLDLSQDNILEHLKFCDEFKKQLNELFIKVKKDYLKIFLSFVSNFYKEKFNKLSYDKILVTFLVSKFKSGFALELNIPGLNNYLEKYYESNKI
jgi:hypothetical protein